MLFAIHKLAFINVFFWDYLDTIASFLAWSIIFTLPSANIELSVVVPQNSLGSFGKNNTVFILFHIEISILPGNLNVKKFECLDSKLHQLLLIKADIRIFSQLRHLDVSYLDFWHLFILIVIFLVILDVIDNTSEALLNVLLRVIFM